MVSAVAKALHRVQGFVNGDGTRDSTVYLEDHTLVADLRGRDVGKAAFLVRGLDAVNAPTELLRINKDGSGAVGVGGMVVDPNRMFFISGTYSGAAGAIGLGVGPTLTVPDGGDGGGIYVDAFVRSAVTTQNGHLYGMMIQPAFLNRGAGALNLEGLFVRQYDVTGQGFTRSIGISVDAPIGAVHNYSIQNSGVVQMRGASAFYFEQVSETTDFIVGGATGNDVYVPGSQAGDLCTRGSVNRKVLWSVDAGATAHMVLASSGLTLGVAELKASVATFAIASSTVTTLNIASSGCVTFVKGQLRVDSAQLYVRGAANAILSTLAAVTSGAGSSTGTLTNAPAAGNPTKWIPFDDFGTTRFIPAW